MQKANVCGIGFKRWKMSIKFMSSGTFYHKNSLVLTAESPQSLSRHSNVHAIQHYLQCSLHFAVFSTYGILSVPRISFLRSFRRCHLLQAKMEFYILVAVLTWLLSNCWTDFHQIFTKRHLCSVNSYCWYPMKISFPKEFCGLKHPLLSENSDSTVFGWPLCGNEKEFWEN